MGRMAFGGAVDYTQVFTALYNNYQDRLESLSLRLENRTDAAQRAEDNDAVDRWQNGEMTDDEFLAYANGRLQETAGDTEDTAYWNKVIRDARKAMLSEQINEEVEDLIDGIEAGTKTWADLRNYYKSQQAGLNTSDPLYKQIDDQLDEIDDRIEQNRVEGEFARIDFEFSAGRISGGTAASQIRALAARYKENDPARYYQLLQKANELSQFGGFSTGGRGGGGGGGGRGGGGGGGGSSSPSLSATIDALQGIEERIMSLSDQFKAGAIRGSITYLDETGALVTDELLLRNPDGTPTDEMRFMDRQMLDVLDQLQQAVIEREGGDSNMAGDIQQRRENYVLDHIQPRNTIGPEMQAATLQDVGMGLIERAANSGNPTAAWRKVQQWANRVERWESRLAVDPSSLPDERDGLADQRTQPIRPVGRKAEDRTTDEFASDAARLAAFARSVAQAQTVDQIRALSPLIEEMMGSERAERVIAVAEVAVDLVTGIPDGRYVRAIVPGQGLMWVPLVPNYTMSVDETGNLVSDVKPVPGNPDGTPIWDPERGQQLQRAMVEIDGRVEEVYTVTEPYYTRRDAEGVLHTLTAREFAAADPSDGNVYAEYQVAVLPGPNGAAQTWIFDGTQWHLGRVRSAGGVPMPFAGQNASAAQRYASEHGYDETGMAYKAPSATPIGQFDPRNMGGTRSWHQDRLDRDRADQQLARRTALGGERADRGQASDLVGREMERLRSLTANLGIRVAAEQATKKPPALPPTRSTLPPLVKMPTPSTIKPQSKYSQKVSQKTPTKSTTPTLKLPTLPALKGPAKIGSSFRPT